MLHSLFDPLCIFISVVLGLLAFESSTAVGEVLLSDGFEADPSASGWTRSGPGATWTATESAAGAHSLMADSDTWSSPLLETEPVHWYRLSFRSKAPGTVTNIGSIGYAYWSAVFYDANGVLLHDDQYSSVLQSSGWVSNEFRIRAKHRAGSGGILVPVRLKVSFHPLGNQPLYIDDVLVEDTSIEEVAAWSDSLYESLPAQLDYVPKSDRWQRIPQTIQKLRTAQSLRIVMLGDSVQADTANAPLDALLQRAYPGSRIELISSTKGGTGVGYFKDHIAEYVTDYMPDLLMIGGISHPDDMSAFQSVIDQVRAHDSTNGRTTEILIQTKAWSSNNNFGNYFLTPETRELDQDAALNPTIPDNYRGHLLSLAHTNGIEYLDMTGIAAEFIYGRAAAAGVGAPANANGDPYSFWLRDWVHSNDYGKQILGRELEIYFAPPPSLSIGRTQTGNFLLSWPGYATGYALEFTDELRPPVNWGPLAQSSALINGRRRLSLAMPPAILRQFYRLTKP